MTQTSLLMLVARREIRDRLTNKPFLVTTAVSLLLIIAAIVGPSLFGDDEPQAVELGVLADAGLPAGFEQAADAAAAAQSGMGGALLGEQQPSDHPGVNLTTFDDRTSAETAVQDGTVDGVVLSQSTLLVDDPSTRLDDVLAQAMQTANATTFMTDAGVDPEELQRALAVPDIQVETLSGQDAEGQDVQFGLGFAITVLLFITLQINGGSILTTTVEEKSSRVVEVLLGVLRPWQLLAGKLLAMTLLSVLQLLLYAGTALVASNLVGSFSLPASTGSALAASIAMFLVGFALYASVYAVAGALAGSAEEAQAAAGPIGFLSVGIYMMVILGVIPTPHSTMAQILTWVPFSAPFAVPVRAGAGLPLWEAGLAFVITGVATVIVVRFAGRLYSAAVLSGGKMSWRAAFKAEPIR